MSETAPGSSDARPATSGIDNLKKMSTTAGVGIGDYTEVNTVAVVSLVVAIAGLLALFSNLFLVLCLAALVLSIVAWVQISKSGGTQTGKGLATSAAIIGLLIGSYVLGKNVLESRQEQQVSQEVNKTIEAFSQAVSKHDYDAAYALTSAPFQTRIPGERFNAVFKEFDRAAGFGGIQSMTWNRTPMLIVGSATTPTQVAAGIIVHYGNANSPDARINLEFVPESGQWKVQHIPQIFD